MAAPASTSRGTPVGYKFDDGFSTKIAFARGSTASFWEKTVSPPGVDGGDEIDISTMHNTTWRTFAARNLKTLSPFQVTAAYDAAFYADTINNLINQEGAITCHFPDGSKLDFFGFLKSFEVGAHTEGEQPEVTLSIVPTNYDPVNRVEAAPVLTSVTGT